MEQNVCNFCKTGMKEDVWEELFSRLCTLKDNCEREFRCPIVFKPQLDKHLNNVIELMNQLSRHPVAPAASAASGALVSNLRYYQDTRSLLKQMEIIPSVISVFFPIISTDNVIE